MILDNEVKGRQIIFDKRNAVPSLEIEAVAQMDSILFTISSHLICYVLFSSYLILFGNFVLFKVLSFMFEESCREATENDTHQIFDRYFSWFCYQATKDSAFVNISGHVAKLLSIFTDTDYYFARLLIWIVIFCGRNSEL